MRPYNMASLIIVQIDLRMRLVSKPVMSDFDLEIPFHNILDGNHIADRVRFDTLASSYQ